MGQQIDALRMAVFEASTRAEQTAEQYKRDAVDAAVLEIEQDREAFAEGRREAMKRIGELEDALEIALKAAGGVHGQLLELGLSCEDLGKTSVHLSVAAQEAPEEDKPALTVAGDTIEAVVGVMRAMEGSGVFDILDPVDDDEEEAEGGEGEGDEEAQSQFVLGDVPAIVGSRGAARVTPLHGLMGVGPAADSATSAVAGAGEFDYPCSDVATAGFGSVAGDSNIGGGNGHDDSAAVLGNATAATATTLSSVGVGVPAAAEALPQDDRAPAAVVAPRDVGTRRERGRDIVENGNHFVNMPGGTSVGPGRQAGGRGEEVEGAIPPAAAAEEISIQEGFDTGRTDGMEQQARSGTGTGPQHGQSITGSVSRGTAGPAASTIATVAPNGEGTATVAMGAPGLSPPPPEDRRRRQDRRGGGDSLDSSGSGVAEAVMVAVAASRQGVRAGSGSGGGDSRGSSPDTGSRATATTRLDGNFSGQARNDGRAPEAAAAGGGMSSRDEKTATERNPQAGRGFFRQHPPFD
ncbi:unnamed protein product [Scytosiphon promiscuus]